MLAIEVLDQTDLNSIQIAILLHAWTYCQAEQALPGSEKVATRSPSLFPLAAAGAFAEQARDRALDVIMAVEDRRNARKTRPITSSLIFRRPVD